VRVPQQAAGWTTADTVSILIASLALLFTVGTFWWLNARRGKLHLVGKPRSYAISTAGGKLHLNVPLSFYNSGPTPVWASNLKLLLNTPGLPEVVDFVATRPGVQPQADDNRPMATQVALAGREARVICCEFIETGSSGSRLREGTVPVTVAAIEHRTWGGLRERKLGAFELRVTADTVAIQGQYVVHDNYD
jgi:hypothetical protein